MNAINTDKKVQLTYGGLKSSTDTSGAAKNAGLDCIGCEWGFRGRKELENAGAKYIAEVPQDIVSICHEINRI